MELAALYRDIVEKSPDAMWVYDHDGRTIYSNPALRALFGVDDEAEMAEITVFDSVGLAAQHLAVAAALIDLARLRDAGSTVRLSVVRAAAGR